MTINIKKYIKRFSSGFLKPTKRSSFRSIRFDKLSLAVFVVIFVGLGSYLLFHSRADVTCTSTISPGADVASAFNVLGAGSTLCLHAGNYGSTSTLIQLSSSGTSGAPITMRNVPGETAVIQGWMDITGSYVIVQHLTIDDSNTFYTDGGGCNHTTANPAPQALAVNGTGDVLEYDDIYQSVASLRGVLIGIGFGGSQGDNAIIRYNKLHDAGSCQAYDHIIYVAHGNGITINGNWMWNDPHGWGVQVYPGPSNVNIYSNVIDSAGSGFVVAGDVPDDGTNTSNVTITNNIVMNSTGLSAAGTTGAFITTCCTQPLGTNSVTNNDSYNNPDGLNPDSIGNFTFSGNISSNPLFTDPANHDYTLQNGSPAAGYGLWNGVDPYFSGGGGTNPPVAAFTFSPTSPVTGQQVTFNASGSTCTNAPCTYAWSDQGTALGSGQPFNFTFQTAATKQVQLLVTDSLGQTSSVEHDVVVTAPVAGLPATPTGLTATPGNNQVVLNWNANPSGDNVTGYNVYRTDQTTSPWATVTTTTFTNADQVSNGTQYCYQISAINAQGESTKSSQACATPAAGISDDINNDGHVTIVDLSLLLSSYGSPNAACVTAPQYTCDLNGDGSVNIVDLSILLSHYGI